MTFDIIVKSTFGDVTLDNTLSPIDNKSVLGIINDFENGGWRYERFQNYIWNNIQETALSHNERHALLKDGAGSVLSESAKKLRLVEAVDAIGRGSEIAEIVLYGIMKDYYSALPIVPKIFYKQNTGDEAKGSDSVHIVVESADSFSLWFGESKFYNNIENTRLDRIVDSIKDSISLDKIRKENSIITNLNDLNEFDGISDNLKIKIKASLSQDISLDLIKPILNIPILLLYECDQTKQGTELTDEYKEGIREYHRDRATSYFRKQIQKCSSIHLYNRINFHIILFPVAEKLQIVNKFIQIAHAYRD